jgi:preprotein translocase subunit YajC
VIFHAHDVGDFIHAGANFETGPRVEIVKKNGHAVVALRHEDDKAPQRIVIPKPQTELSPKEIRRQIGQLQKKLKLVLKVEDLCEKLRNLKVGDMIVSKSGTRRKITRVDEDSVTFIRNGDKKESTMRIAEIIERHLYAFEAVISAKKPPENDRDLFKTQQL